jgi:hypothetical protein
MKIVSPFLALLIFISCASAREKSYTASTPAGAEVKTFLGIPLADSVDFIRWYLVFDDNDYELHCNYGIGKPNTNGFINGGKTIQVEGIITKEKNIFQFKHGDKILKAAELNGDLIHLLDDNNNLLVGNGGWSYTLNNLNPKNSEEINFASTLPVLKDSITYDGRTPCKIPGLIPTGKECYKVKWRIIFYADARKNEPSSYRIWGTNWRKEGNKTGNMKIIKGTNNRIMYQLNDDDGKGFIYLLKLDEHILVFTDANGKLLVGDEDFSYTLNQKL